MSKKILFLIFLGFSNLIYSQMPNTLSDVEKIYGLSKFWQEVNYNFVYLEKIDREEWEAEYKKMIAEVQKTENDYEYYKLLKKFCAKLDDGHTNVYFPKNIKEKITYTDFGDYKIFVSNIDDKAIVTRVNLSKKGEIPIGSEITKVNGIKTAQYINENITPYISSSTDYILKDWGIWKMLKGPLGTKLDIELKLPNGKTKHLKLTREKAVEKEVYPTYEKRELYEFKWLGDKIAYIALNSFSDEKITDLFVEKLPELYKAKKLVVDLRNNGGGSTGIGLDIFKYLTKDSLLYGSKSQSRLHIPAYKAWGEWVGVKDTANGSWARKSYLSYHDKLYYDFSYEPDTVRLKSKRIAVPTVLLIGHNTASAAEDFLIYAYNQEHMTKIGEPTFGSTGQPMMFDLPGGGYARICTKKDTYPDGREFVGVGVQPDIKVSKSLSDFMQNKDPALEKAVEFLNGIE